MSTKTTNLSLKGGSQVWRGLTDATHFQPSVGIFSTLRNICPSRDGTELRSFPGLVKVAEPGFYSEPMLITHVSAMPNGNAALQIATTDVDTYGDGSSGFPIEIYIEGVSSNTTLGSLADGVYTAARIGSQSIEVNSSFAGDTYAQTTVLFPTVRIRRGSSERAHGLAWVAGFPCVVTESTVWMGDGGSPARSIATWVGDGPLDWDAATANRYEYWPSPVNGYVDPSRLHNRKYTDHRPRRKANLDVSEDRLLMAVPGWGVMMEAHIGVKRSRVSDADPSSQAFFPKFSRWTRLLGLPKGDAARDPVTGLFARTQLLTNAALEILNQNSGGFHGSQGIEKIGGVNSSFLGPGQTVWFAVAYKNRYTGEMGLASEPFRATTGTNWAKGSGPAGFAGVYFEITVPNARWELQECADVSVVLYTTGADVNAGWYPIYEEVQSNDPHGGVSFLTIWKVGLDESWDALPRFPILEQLPVGACTVKTIRGFTLSGGWLPLESEGNDDSGTPYYDDSQDKEEITAHRIQRFGVSVPGTRPDLSILNANPEKKDSSIEIPGAGTLVSGNRYRYEGSVPFRGSVAAGYKLPSSFQGHEVFLPWAVSKTGTPVSGTGGNTNRARLTKKINSWFISNLLSEFRPRWEIDGKFRSLVPAFEPFGMAVLVDKGIIQVSEREHPGIAPATNRIVVDRLKGTDIRGIARIGDSAIVCTETETYGLAWGSSPVGSDPVQLSDQYGCIAPNSMIEYPGGVAWLGREGPVASTGGRAQWIGDPIRDFWGSLKRDSRGEMWHAFGVCDLDRSLLIWGVRSDWGSTGYADATNDEDRSFVACDELLIYHYPTGVWSTYRPPSGQTFVGASRMLSADGQWRTTFLEGDGNIYQIDDRFQDHRLDSLSASATSAASGSATFTATGTDFSSIQDGQYGLIRASDGTLKWWGTLSSGGADTIVLSSVATWASGDVLEAGVRYFRFETRLSRYTDTHSKDAVEGIVLRHSIAKDYPTIGSTHYTYATGSVNRPDGTSTSIVSADAGAKRLTGSQTSFRNMGTQNMDDWTLVLEVFGTGAVRIKDVFLEVARGG